MLRRFLVILIRRSFLLLLVVCLGCVAQTASPDLARKIERQVRSYYKIPPEVRVVVGVPTPSSDFPNYDSVVVTVDSGEKKQDLKFVVSKDGSSLVRTIKFDLSKDPFAETMSKIDVNGRPTRGAKASKVVVVNFDDFECPFCARMHQTLFPEILKEYGDRVTFIYKDYPLVEIHPWADARRGGRQLPGGAEQRRLLGFRGLHSRQPARGEQRKDAGSAAGRASTSSPCCKARNTILTS